MNDVTDILRDRMTEPAGLQRMAMISGAVHVILLTMLALTSGRLLTRASDAPRSVMTITLGGGAPGPQNGGMTSIGGKAVQAQAPPEAAKRPEPVRAPAAKTPLMTLPKPGVKPTQAASKTVKEGPDKATGRTPTQGAETSPGNAVAETGVRGQGFGLSTGGGGGSGSRLDVADFCCPEYIVTMVERIRGNWNARAGALGEAIVVFTIERDGRLTNVALERSSNNPVLDLNAQKALYATKQLPPLPGAFPNPTLTVHLNFQYTR
jgi:TonB family protein